MKFGINNTLPRVLPLQISKYLSEVGMYVNNPTTCCMWSTGSWFKTVVIEYTSYRRERAFTGDLEILLECIFLDGMPYSDRK